MDASNTNDDQVIVHDFHPRFRVYKSGRVERLIELQIVPPSPDPAQNVAVLSKDVVVSPETGVSVRIFAPAEVIKSPPKQKLPLLVYAHGGYFCLLSAFSSSFHSYMSTLSSLANAIAVSIDYRLAPEHPIPACYEDSWAAIQWLAAHHNGTGPDPWLNDHIDFNRVYLGGDSAGANMMDNMLLRLGSDPPHVLKIAGAALIHPFFANDEPDKLLDFLCSDNAAGIHDPRVNPARDLTRMARIRTGKVLIFVAEKDHLRERGVSYYEALKRSEWVGEVEIVETEGEGHVFHVFDQTSEKALALFKRLASFLNGA